MPVAAAIAASDRKVGRSVGGLNEPFVAVAGTLDTKGEELRFIADIIKAAGLPVKLVDLSTCGPDLRRGCAAAGDRAASPARFRRDIQCRPRRRRGGDGGGVRDL